jgi:hypothetical protein
MRSKRTATRVALAGAIVLAALGGVAIALAASAPVNPTLTSTPPNPSASTSASFSFTGESGSTFECKLDALAFSACTNPKPYATLTPTSHTFKVHAIKSGKTSGDTAYTWSVSVPAVPTIGTKPTNPTNAQSATFSFTTDASNATFECALESPFTFTACSSPKSYPGLSAGSHEFRVRALGPSGTSTGTSSAASYAWTIDLSPPPAPTLGPGPPASTKATSATISFSDSEPGVSFSCKLDTAAFASCSSPKSYSGLGDGLHTFQVKARDAAGNDSSVASRSWTVDTVPPPPPVITTRPDDPNGSAISTFEWTDSEGGVSFECSIENGAFQTCSSGVTYVVDVSNSGTHQFAVHAVDQAGNISSAASWSWKVDSGVHFTITGGASGPLHPAQWVPLALTIVNQMNFTIYVTSLQVTVADNPSCPTAANIEVQQSDIDSTLAKRVAVPANSSTLVTSARRPQIRLRNLATNQDACKGKLFHLTYAGAATK